MFIACEYLVFQTPEHLGGPALNSSFMPVFLDYWGDQNGYDTLGAAFLMPNEGEWLWPTGYVLSDRVHILHVCQDTLLATGKSQTLFVKLVASQYVPSISRMLHSALFNFIKSLPASPSLIPSAYSIALHPIVQASNEDIKQHQPQ